MAGQGGATVWCLTDGKAGHLNQLRGLTRALSQLLPIHTAVIEVPAAWPMAWQWLRGRFAPGQSYPDPNLILAAGHQTHLAALAARRARGGRLVVLMNPSLPCAWFDLCLVPEHDATAVSGNVVVTRGVLNNITFTPPEQHRPDHGLILVGGPSGHHGWDGAATAAQIARIVSRDPQRHWHLTTSRRTPAEFPGQLPSLERLAITPVSQTPPGWVGEQMAQAAVVWVTEDSVSMVYEALSAGAAVGVLPVPRQDQGRVSRGLDKLCAEGWLTSYQQWEAGAPLGLPPARLDEADRCARLLVERFLQPPCR